MLFDPGACCACTSSLSQTITVTGCNSLPLPDAIVTLYSDSGRTIVQSSGTTGPDGKVTLSYTTPVYYRTTHSSGRFLVNNNAPGVGVTLSMTVATGYACCVPGPYPVPTTLKVTDQEGTLAVPMAFGTCGGSAGTTRTMAVVGDQCAMRQGWCYDGSNYRAVYIPPVIGSGPAAIGYSYELSSSGGELTATATQTTYERETVVNSVYTPYNPDQIYEPDYGVPGVPCLDRSLLRRWVCATGSTPDRVVRTSTSFTINSLYPLNITFAFDVGEGWGPVPSPNLIPDGSPYATTLVLHE